MAKLMCSLGMHCWHDDKDYIIEMVSHADGFIEEEIFTSKICCHCKKYSKVYQFSRKKHEVGK
jgi:hypothetical protein